MDLSYNKKFPKKFKHYGQKMQLMQEPTLSGLRIKNAFDEFPRVNMKTTTK